MAEISIALITLALQILTIFLLFRTKFLPTIPPKEPQKSGLPRLFERPMVQSRKSKTTVNDDETLHWREQER